MSIDAPAAKGCELRSLAHQSFSESQFLILFPVRPITQFHVNGRTVKEKKRGTVSVRVAAMRKRPMAAHSHTKNRITGPQQVPVLLS